MGKTILPHLQGLPYTTPDGRLLCLYLSTFSALQYIFLDKKPWDAKPQAWKDMMHVKEQGVQVEWK
eukprot:6760179-Karenia_brevis.AAC.1